MQKIGGDISIIGYSVTLYMIATGILIILIGKLSDKWKKEWITIFGYAIFSITAIGYIFISHTWQLFILQIISALGTACLASPLTALMSHSIDKKHEGLQWAIEGGGSKIVIGLAIFVGTFIITYLGFTILFVIVFILDITAMLVQLQLIVNKKKS